MADESISEAEYARVQSQMMLLGALVRELPLAAFIRRIEHAESVSALFAPSHWIAGQEKLEMILKLARALRAFQAVLPTMAEATAIDERTDKLRERLGV